MALSRAQQRIIAPVQAIFNLGQEGILPPLQSSDPTKIQSYLIPSGFSAPTVEAAEQALTDIAATTGLQVIETQKDPETTFLGGLADFALKAFSFFSTKGGSTVAPVIQAGKPVQVQGPNIIGTQFIAPTQGGYPMAFQDGDTGWFGSDIFGGINQVLQGGLGNQLLGLGTQALQGFVSQQFAPQPASYPMSGPAPVAQPAMAAVPALGRAVATVGRSFFNRFPNLATAIQSLRNRGANVSRSTLYSALRKFGPEMLVTGGILTAAAVSELAVAGPGRRRMNPGNVKALRRAHRRMKSFHRVCVDNDQLLKRRRK